MKIGLDFDGVISDCGKLKSIGSKKLFGVSIPSEKFKKEIVVGKNHLTLEQYQQLQRVIYETWETGMLMEPVSGVLRHIPLLIADGHSLVVITSREKTGLAIAQGWSAQQGLQLDFIGVGGGKSKADAAKGLDVFIDDDLDKLEPLQEIVPHRFLFSWGYNTHIETGATAQRVTSWAALYQAIQAIQC